MSSEVQQGVGGRGGIELQLDAEAESILPYLVAELVRHGRVS